MSERTGSLRYFTTIKNGSTPASGEPSYWDGDVLWATPDDLGRLGGNYIGKTKRMVTPLAVAENNLNLVPPDTVLMSTRAPIGHMAITSAPLTFNQGCRALIPHEDTWGAYLFYLLKSRVPELNASANGTTFVELSRDDLASVRVSLPPLETQKRIAGFLDEKTARIDALIAKKEALLARLAEKRQAIITQAVTKGLNPAAPMKDSGIEWLGQIPAHWTQRRLRFDACLNPVKSQLELEDEDKVSFIPMDAVGELGGLRLEEQRSVDEVYTGYTYFCDGDVVIAKITPCFENGKGALAEGLTNSVGFGTTELHVVRPNDTLDERFLFYITMAHGFRALGTSEMLGAGGQKRVPERFLKDWRPALPPLEIQAYIAAFLNEQTARIDDISDEVRESIERVSEYRSALITAAVTGQIKELR